MTRRFKPPIFATSKRGETMWTLNIGEDEQAVVADLLGQLRTLLSSDGSDTGTSPLLDRLFPKAYTADEDAEKEAEYQRLMREELVASRLFQIEAVAGYIASGEEQVLDEGQVIALMQSVNAVRVVLGTMLDVSDDDDDLPGGEDDEFEVERRLYAFLSWLLDWIVRSLQT